MSWETDLIEGLSQFLDDAGAGTYRPAGTYTAGEVGIYHRVIPQDGQCISLALYPASPDLPGIADTTVAVQVRVRGDTDPDSCADLGAAVYEALHGAHDLTFGAVKVVQIWRQSWTSLGDDDNSRWEASHNYYVQAMRPNTNNPD